MPTTQLGARERSFLAAARRAVLATIDPHGRPRLVPICFVLDAREALLVTPLDEKPKTGDDPLDLARVRDIRARPAVTILVDRWSEDWTRLGWLRLAGTARIVAPDGAPDWTIEALRAKYPQYASHRLEARPLIAISITRTTSWGALDAALTDAIGREPG
jgi:PPOX class probable F420-dependent enzyme